MKIALVSEHASPLSTLGGVDSGGQNVHVAELAAALARRGNQVSVYTRRSDPDAAEVVRAPDGYDVVHVPAGPAEYVSKDELLPYIPEFTDFLARRWARHRPDVVHAHFWMSGLAAQHACRNSSLPVLQTFHALGVTKRRCQREADTSPGERIKIERVLARGAARVLATCSDEAAELTRMGTPRGRITVVPCGVDLDEFTPDGPAHQKTSRRRLVAVGRLVPRKGFDTAISALRWLPETELLIAGGPDAGELATDPEVERLRRHAYDLGVADRVRLLGAVPRGQLPPLLRSADAVVCSPLYEPFGMVPLEAMGCGVPVIASAVGGLLDTVIDHVTGLHVRPQRPGEIAQAARELFSKPELANGYGAAGHDRARARYSWERVAEDTERAYLASLPSQEHERASA